MLDFVIQKMLNRRWIVLCLLIGNILLVGIACCNPMYTDAIQQKTLNKNMNDFILENNRNPGTIVLDAQLKIDGSTNTANQFTEARDFITEMDKQISVPTAMKVYHYYVPKQEALTDFTYDGEQLNKKLSVGYMENIADHINIVSGEMYKDTADEDGIIDAIVSQKGLVSQKFLVGETLTFKELTDPAGNPVRIRIAGVFENSEEDDIFWVNGPNAFTSEILISEQIFKEYFVDYKNPKYPMRGAFYLLLDYGKMRGADVDGLIADTKEFQNKYSQVSAVVFRAFYMELLEQHQVMEKKVVSTLQILQVPILVLLAAFIFMVSKQILEIEKNDIAILKSRGASKKQLVISYMLQGSIVAGIGFVIGIPVAMILCQMFGSANSFLGFVQRSALRIRISPMVLLYGIGAVLLSIVAMTMPVFKYADLTIVEHKQKNSDKKKYVWWQRYFIDFLLLAISIYGLYSYNDQKEMLIQNVAEGGSLNPMLFLMSSLFIIGAALLALRVIPLALRLAFQIGKNTWQPALYASFLRIIRTKNKQYFIIVFLTLTIAMGIFNAKTARTINQGEEERISYQVGADVVLQERWSDEEEAALQSFESSTIEETEEQEEERKEASVNPDDYTEPDIEKYKAIEGVEKVAKVYRTDAASISVETTVEKAQEEGATIEDIKKGKYRYENEQLITDQKVTLMGIHTKDFGETAWFRQGLLPTHWYHYLNAISQNASAVLVSSNFRDELGYKIGEQLTYRTARGEAIQATIYGFVDYWPTFQPTRSETLEDGTKVELDQYLIVANLIKLQNVDGILPYQVWMKVDGSTQPIYDFIGNKEIKLISFSDRQSELIDMKNEPIIQGTNGILTVGFIVVLLLCAVGFLIYWVISIQSRALQFGIFRAMGMTMKELMLMLVGEQICITVPAILMGIAIGLGASQLYIPLIQIAYVSTQSPLPLMVESAVWDIVKMFVIVAIVVAVCMAVLGWLISKINVSQALKLGED